MPRKVATFGLLLFGLLHGLLHAQQYTEAERRFFGRVDTALGVRPGAIIADIGTGKVLIHPFRIAKAVGPEGKVLCVDIVESAVASIKEQVKEAHVVTIEASLGKEDDPLLAPNTFDAVLISNAYHEIVQHDAILKHVREALKPDGRLVIVEGYTSKNRRSSRAAQVQRHEISPEILETELTAAGFTIKERIDPLLVDNDDFRYLFMAEK